MSGVQSQSGNPKQRLISDYSEDSLDAATRSIQRLEAIFKSEFDLDIYLTWGTLLGAIREGDYIGFDNDIDVAYLTQKTTDYEIVEEHELIVRVLREAGIPVLRNSKGQIHVRLYPDETQQQGNLFNLDLWTTWCRDGRYYHYPDIKGELTAAEVMPLQRWAFRGYELWVPSGYKSVLNAFYGADWQTPDPGYAWYPKYDADDEFEFLRSRARDVELPDLPTKAANLTVEERDGLFYVTGDTVVDEQRLNHSGMLILELSNGRNDCAKIIELVQAAFNLPSAPEVAVLEFITNAIRAGLIQASETQS